MNNLPVSPNIPGPQTSPMNSTNPNSDPVPGSSPLDLLSRLRSILPILDTAITKLRLIHQENPPSGIKTSFTDFPSQEASLEKVNSEKLPGADGWEALKTRMARVNTAGNREILVATLYGPTGAGKSTLFRLLTGIPVPAGDEIRPVSYACAVAVPPDWTDPQSVAAILPGLEPVPFRGEADLKNPNTPPGVVFYAPAKIDSPTDIHLVLADVPDFNSLESRNWERAERLLRQAEVVVFLLTPDTYADQVTVRELERACRIAARMIVVFTKVLAPTTAEGARKTRAKWDDLVLSKLPDLSHNYGISFAARRGDGRTLLEFLKSCPVHWSPHSFQTSLDSLVPLESGSPNLASWLLGHQAGKILLEGVSVPAREASRHGIFLLDSFKAKSKALKDRLAKTQKPIEPVARAIASSEFPLGRMIEVVHEETAKKLPGWYQTVAHPTGWVMNQIAKPVGWMMDRVSSTARLLGGQIVSLWGQGTQTGEIANIKTVEAKRIEEGADLLMDQWREAFPGEARESGLLATDRIRTLRRDFLAQPTPQLSNDWEKSLREEAAAWATTQAGSRTLMLHVTGRLLVLGGAAMMAIDLVTTGGLVTMPLLLATGKVGVAAAAATGSLTAGALMNWIEKMNLQRVLGRSEEAFRDQRTRELTDHIEQFRKALFAPWETQAQEWRKLENGPLAQWETAVADLRLVGHPEEVRR